MSIRTWQQKVHALAVSKGWWDGYPYDHEDDGPRFILTPDQILAKLALIHSEVSEALEDVRVGKMATTFAANGKPVGFPTELADIVIRCMDLAGAMGIDLEREIEVKSAFNETRPYKHGGKRA